MWDTLWGASGTVWDWVGGPRGPSDASERPEAEFMKNVRYTRGMSQFFRLGTLWTRISEALGGAYGDVFCHPGRLLARLWANWGVLERSLGVPNQLRGKRVPTRFSKVLHDFSEVLHDFRGAPGALLEPFSEPSEAVVDASEPVLGPSRDVWDTLWEASGTVWDW
eukprot:8239234-Pyramimonas_sp.AAC.1